MSSGNVVLRYSPTRWKEMSEQKNEATHSKIVSFNYSRINNSQNASYGAKAASSQPVLKKRHLVSLGSSSFERPVNESLRNISLYTEKMRLGEKSATEIEREWYYDVTNVAQRLKFLRDTFKVLQSARKRKVMGERADFRGVYDAKALRMGTPSLSDDDTNTHPFSDDDKGSNLTENSTPAPVSRRGRPRKMRGRGRKALGASIARTALKRTRASKKILEEASSSGSTPGSSVPSPETHPDAEPPAVLPQTPIEVKIETPAPAVVSRRRGRPPSKNKISVQPKPLTKPNAESRGPPLMHSPPILPSQRLPISQRVPTYHNLSTSQPLSGSIPAESGSEVSATNPGKESKKTPTFLPSQVTFPVKLFAPSDQSGPKSSSINTGKAFLPAQVQRSGVMPYQFPNYQIPQAMENMVSSRIASRDETTKSEGTSQSKQNIKPNPQNQTRQSLQTGTKSGISSQTGYPHSFTGSIGFTTYTPGPYVSMAKSIWNGYDTKSMDLSNLSSESSISQAGPSRTTSTFSSAETQPKPMIVGPKSVYDVSSNPSKTLSRLATADVTAYNTHDTQTRQSFYQPNLSAHSYYDTSYAPPQSSYNMAPLQSNSESSYMYNSAKNTSDLPYNHMQSTISQGYSGVQQDRSYSSVSTQQPGPEPQFGSWQASYSESAASGEHLGMALPNLKALEDEIRNTTHDESRGNQENS